MYGLHFIFHSPPLDGECGVQATRGGGWARRLSRHFLTFKYRELWWERMHRIRGLRSGSTESRVSEVSWRRTERGGGRGGEGRSTTCSKQHSPHFWKFPEALPGPSEGWVRPRGRCSDLLGEALPEKTQDIDRVDVREGVRRRSLPKLLVG